jgi:hypothetical protein
MAGFGQVLAYQEGVGDDVLEVCDEPARVVRGLGFAGLFGTEGSETRLGLVVSQLAALMH